MIKLYSKEPHPPHPKPYVFFSFQVNKTNANPSFQKNHWCKLRGPKNDWNYSKIINWWKENGYAVWTVGLAYSVVVHWQEDLKKISYFFVMSLPFVHFNVMAFHGGLVGCFWSERISQDKVLWGSTIHLHL